MQPGWLRTYTGKLVCLRAPTKDMIVLEDVAHHLSLENRWAGSTARPYSVAEHSLWVARRMAELSPPGQEEYGTLLGLMHDAHEYVLKDVPTPMKVMLPSWYKEACNEWDYAMADAFGYPFPLREWRDLIHKADAQVAWVESQNLFIYNRPPAGEEPLDGFEVWMGGRIREPRAAKDVEIEFLNLARQLIAARKP